jgi:hypothetical protein
MLKIRSFVTDGPSTAEFGIGSPGYVSLYTGKHIIDAFMEKNSETKLEQMLAMDARKILTASAYKPR